MFVGVRLLGLTDAEIVARPFASEVGSSGVMHFGRRPDLKKDKLASTLHEITAAN
jgi:hypothetical protein